jgi:hypothetical protein
LNTLDKAYEGKRGFESRRKDKSPKGFFSSAYAELVAVGRSIGEAFHALKPPKKRNEKNRNEWGNRNRGSMDSLIVAERPATDFEIMRMKDKLERIYAQTITDAAPVTENRVEEELTELLEPTEQVYELRKPIRKKQAVLFRGRTDPDQTARYESQMFARISINHGTDAVTHRSDIDEETKVHSAFNGRKSQEDMCRAFASALNEYLQPVEVMVGKVLRGKSDTESMAALLGMLLSLRSVSSRMGFDTLQELLDQLYLRLLILDGDPRVPITREIRIAILRDVFKLRDIAIRMGEVTNKMEKDPLV